MPGRPPLNVVPSETLSSLITSSEASHLAGVSVAAICNWRERGYLAPDPDHPGKQKRVHLTPAGHDRRNRPLYRWIDVAKAEHATRTRARRTYPTAA